MRCVNLGIVARVRCKAGSGGELNQERRISSSSGGGGGLQEVAWSREMAPDPMLVGR